MFVAAFFQRLVELTQQAPLVLAELDRCFHCNVTVQIAGVACAHAFYALAAQSELLAGLGALGDVNSRFARQRGHVDLATERRGCHADGNRAMQVIAIALEDVVFLESDLDVQVTLSLIHI